MRQRAEQELAMSLRAGSAFKPPASKTVALMGDSPECQRWNETGIAKGRLLESEVRIWQGLTPESIRNLYEYMARNGHDLGTITEAINPIENPEAVDSEPYDLWKGGQRWAGKRKAIFKTLSALPLQNCREMLQGAAQREADDEVETLGVVIRQKEEQAMMRENQSEWDEDDMDMTGD